MSVPKFKALSEGAALKRRTLNYDAAAERALLAEKQPSLRFTRPEDIGGAVVFLCSMGIPLLKLLCQLAVLLSIRWKIGRSYGLLLYRIYHHMKDWGMLEVYLMGVLVAIVKLADMASITIGLGLVCFVSLLMVQVLLEVVMSPHQIWQALSGEDDHAGD